MKKTSIDWAHIAIWGVILLLAGVLVLRYRMDQHTGIWQGEVQGLARISLHMDRASKGQLVLQSKTPSQVSLTVTGPVVKGQGMYRLNEEASQLEISLPQWKEDLPPPFDHVDSLENFQSIVANLLAFVEDDQAKAVLLDFLLDLEEVGQTLQVFLPLEKIESLVQAFNQVQEELFGQAMVFQEGLTRIQDFYWMIEDEHAYLYGPDEQVLMTLTRVIPE